MTETAQRYIPLSSDGYGSLNGPAHATEQAQANGQATAPNRSNGSAVRFLNWTKALWADTAAVMGAAPGDRAGAASGVINTARQVGGIIGIALLGALVAHRATFTSGLHVAVVLARGQLPGRLRAPPCRR